MASAYAVLIRSSLHGKFTVLGNSCSSTATAITRYVTVQLSSPLVMVITVQDANCRESLAVDNMEEDERVGVFFVFVSRKYGLDNGMVCMCPVCRKICRYLLN